MNSSFRDVTQSETLTFPKDLDGYGTFTNQSQQLKSDIRSSSEVIVIVNGANRTGNCFYFHNIDLNMWMQQASEYTADRFFESIYVAIAFGGGDLLGNYRCGGWEFATPTIKKIYVR